MQLQARHGPGAFLRPVSNHFPGFIDEVRVSNVIRYTSDFTPPSVPFVRDDFTELLYHFDEAGKPTRSVADLVVDKFTTNDPMVTSIRLVSVFTAIIFLV